MSCGGLFLGIRKSTLMGWSSELGGSPLASSMAVIPSDQISAWNISRSLKKMQKNLLVNWKVQTYRKYANFGHSQWWWFLSTWLTPAKSIIIIMSSCLFVNLKYSATLRKVCNKSTCYTFCTSECTHGYRTTDSALTDFVAIILHCGLTLKYAD